MSQKEPQPEEPQEPDEKIPDEQAAATQADDSAEEVSAQEASAEDVSGEAEVTVEALQETLAARVADVDALKDQALRAHAEAENMRKRAARDVENAHKFALERFATELLPVIDSFERAVEAAADAQAGVQGLELSLKLLFDVLGKSGIEVVDPVGEPFDPTFHEAITVLENPDVEPGSVIEVIQKGYVLNGRLVRAAMVIVAKAAGNDTVDESA